MSKILIISSSLRKNSNSEYLAKECAKGAKEAGNEVEFVSLKDKEIKYCIGCLACQKLGHCLIKDDVAEIMEKVKNVETLVFATPIYYYEMSGQLKTLLDRLNPLYPTDYKFRKVYMIATAAEDGDFVFEKAYSGLGGWVDCFEKAELCSIVSCGGINAPDEAKNHDDIKQKVYSFGKSL